MNDFINLIVGIIASIILGMVIHSTLLHEYPEARAAVISIIVALYGAKKLYSKR